MKEMNCKLFQKLQSKLRKDHERLGLLEAIAAFYQITGLLVEESEQRPCLVKESLLQLHHLILAIVQGNSEDLDSDQIWRLLGIIEEDIYRIVGYSEIILDTVSKIKILISDSGNESKEESVFVQIKKD